VGLARLCQPEATPAGTLVQDECCCLWSVRWDDRSGVAGARELSLERTVVSPRGGAGPQFAVASRSNVGSMVAGTPVLCRVGHSPCDRTPDPCFGTRPAPGEPIAVSLIGPVERARGTSSEGLKTCVTPPRVGQVDERI
jgi:hypothetical protein